MHGWLILFFATALGLMTPGLTQASDDCTEPLVVGWENWPPYQYIDRLGQLIGLDIELLKAIADAAQCQIHFVEVPWKRHLYELKSGRIHIAMGASHNAERQVYALFSDPYRQETMALIVRTDQKQAYPLARLEDVLQYPFSLGVTLGYHYGDEFNRLKQIPAFAARLQPVPHDQISYWKLLRHRLDGMLADPVTVSQQLKQMQLEDNLLRPLFNLYSNDIHLMFSKESVAAATVERFNRGLQRIRDNGTHARILRNYLPAQDSGPASEPDSVR